MKELTAAGQHGRIIAALASSMEVAHDRIGAFSLNHNHGSIEVPPHFMDALWSAALAADCALRRIELVIQEHNSEVWNVFEATLTEELAEPFELPTDKQSRPKLGPPRANPVLLELQALLSQNHAGLSDPDQLLLQDLVRQKRGASRPTLLLMSEM
ncbi:MAG: hypothetical protein WAK55_33005 [Xanthobacteraceae bacterium]